MFEWQDSYLVGDIFIDAEHKILFELAKRLSNEMSSISSEEFKALLTNIIEYTQVHFHHEEELLRDIKWDGLSHHHAQHQKIVTEICEAINSNHDVSALKLKILRLLQRWIVDHVTQDDQQWRGELTKVRGFRK